MIYAETIWVKVALHFDMLKNMKKYLAIPLIMILSIVSYSQEVEVIDVPGLQKLMSQSNGTTKVINF